MVNCKQMHIIFGMVEDKDIDGVLNLLPTNAKYYFTKAQSPRALNEETIKTLASNHHIYGAAYPTVREAYKSAMKDANDDDFIFIGGSSYVVGDFLKTCL